MLTGLSLAAETQSCIEPGFSIADSIADRRNSGLDVMVVTDVKGNG